MSDHIGNILVCETMTHCFFLFVCYVGYHVNIFYVSGTILGLTFLHPDTIVKLPIEIHMQIRDTY